MIALTPALIPTSTPSLKGKKASEIITEPGKVRPVETITIHCEAPDDALLLVDGQRSRIVKEIGGGGEDKAVHVVIQHGSQQVQAVGHIVTHVLEGLLHRFAHQRVGGKVHDGVKVLPGKELFQGLLVGQVALDEPLLARIGTPRWIAARTYSRPSASVKASSCTRFAPASCMW